MYYDRFCQNSVLCKDGGLLFNVETDPNENGENNAAIAFANAFNYISTNKNAYDALAFITDVYSKSEDDSEDGSGSESGSGNDASGSEDGIAFSKNDDGAAGGAKPKKPAADKGGKKQQMPPRFVDIQHT